MAILIRSLYLVAALLLAALSASAEESFELHEQAIKAGLLYNFLKYTDWPPSDVQGGSHIAVCIFGADPFEGYLKPMQGRSVKESEIVIRYVRQVPDTQGCHLLFINAEEKSHWPELHGFLAGKHVLTVSDFSRFTDTGGMIAFGRSDNHISVSLNADAVATAGLHVQDRLLKLVTIVHAQKAAQP